MDADTDAQRHAESDARRNAATAASCERPIMTALGEGVRSLGAKRES
jgi:hypothetical protein